MITAIQNFLLKHNTWFFSILLVVIIVTFVLFIGNQSLFGGRTYDVESQEFYGYDLNNEDDVRALLTHADLSLALDRDMMFSPAFRSIVRERTDYAFLRVAALGLANQLGIPAPTEDELAEFLRSRSSFQNPQTGSFDNSVYQRFRDSIEMDPNMEARTLARVLREDYRIQRVLDALSGPGYALPSEAEQAFLRRETEWTVRVAETSFASFNPEIELSEEDLRAYHAENPARYSVPERVDTTAVFFRAENFVDRVPAPDESALEVFFQRNRGRYAPDSTATEDGEAPPEVTFADVREEVLRDYRLEQARILAQRASEEFVADLYDNEIARDSDGFAAALERHGAETRPVEPYSRGNPPTGTGLSPRLLQSAWIFATTDARYYSDLQETEDGAALLVLDAVLPERQQSFEEVASQVREDLRQEEKRRLFAERAAEWESAFDEALASGRPFSAVAEELGFTVEAPDPFKLASRPPALNFRLWEATQPLDEGEHSDIIIDESRAALTYVVDKTTPSAEAALTAKNETLEDLVRERRDYSGWFALAEWTRVNLDQLQPESETPTL